MGKTQCECTSYKVKTTTKNKNIQKLLMRQKLQGQCKDKIRAWRVLVYSGARRVGGGLHVPLKAAYTQRLFGTVHWRVGKMNMSPFERPRLSTSSLLNTGVQEGTFSMHSVKHAMMLRHQNNLS